MTIDRRSLLAGGALLPLVGLQTRMSPALAQGDQEKADYSLRIATGLAELAPDHIASTTLYNGQFPGRCCASRKTNVPSSTFTTTPTCRSSSTGTAR
ncbi:hypothetical protein [Bradyrhizobium sp. LB11.1]|uniref:hypothetical protein n=1 Tax=Bradyrhizobium sp. LB11.1 TaxID=3156326 RepID=UPI0033980B25